MNFVDPAVLRKVASAHGFGACSPDACAKLDAFLYQVLRSVLDLSRLVSAQRTLQPEHLMTLRKVAVMLKTPVGAPRAGLRQQMGGNDNTLPISYFGGDDSGVYSAAAGQDHTPCPGLVRSALHSDFPTPLLAGGSAGGAPTMPARFFDPMASEPAYSGAPQSGGGQSMPRCLGAEDLQRMLREYRARTGVELRVSEAARSQLRAILELNLHRMLRELRLKCDRKKRSPGAGAAQKKKKAPGGVTLTAAAITSVSKAWCLCLS